MASTHVLVDGYNAYHYTRNGKKGDGVTIFVSEGIPSKCLPVESDDQLENPWIEAEGKEEECRGFRAYLEWYVEAMTRVGEELLRLTAEAAGIDPDWFRPIFAADGGDRSGGGDRSAGGDRSGGGSISVLRLLRYPRRDEPACPAAVDGDYVLQCSEHTDSGFLTLLSTFHYGGLQIGREGEGWLDVPPRPDALVANIGDMLGRFSGGRFKATVHRVVDCGEDRYSVPFFFDPSWDAPVSCRMPFGNPHLSARQSAEGGLTYGHWLLGKILQFAEFKDILTDKKEKNTEEDQ
ncbi:unnamed protein product [Darwinula stevensoni]|uniref:Fe2OG dioxygenase domain-containing protein n=1 Tax=Darwinula stevensoni TaxID=69355 RepID=A0A7R9A4Y1_9CRUS|nr:unnamed protein product [Darwinula stevensoni]CAG0884325.1 unnamed protein product [Darwinula stevensoni]